MTQPKVPGPSSMHHKPQTKQVDTSRSRWDPIASLEKIDHVEIQHTQVRGGVVFYKVEVRHQVNQIPTNVKTVDDPLRKPDYVVLRRFSDFDLLRRHVSQHARREIVGSCRYCDRFRLFMLHCYKQPAAIVKLWAGVETRKRLLSMFLNEIIELAASDERRAMEAPRVCRCPGVRAIPVLVDQFMRHRYLV